MKQYTKKFYTITGVVWGNCWGGGKCGYRANTIQNASKARAINEAKERLYNGSLDSGMGFESLYGAYLTIKTETTILNNDKEFTNTEYEDLIIGDLGDEEIDASYNSN